jgi:hypothetical protein
MNDTAKLLEVLRIVDELNTYIKVLHADGKLNTQDARELLNYCKKANDVL